MNDVKVTVVVPIYGVEKYIERCVRSLFEQTLDSVEYIFVDDCSPDASVEILERVLEEYPHRKPQVLIIRHEVNKGLSHARKTGILAARGYYIIQCDSDDWVDVDMYRAMYEKANIEDADMVICRSWYVSSDSDNKIVSHNPSSNKSQLFKQSLNTEVFMFLWIRMMKRSLFTENNIVYAEGNMFEDVVISTQATYYSKKVSYVDKPYYYYYQNPQSISNDNLAESSIKRVKQAVSNIGIIGSFLKKCEIDKEYNRYLFKYKALTRGFLYPLMSKDNKNYKLWLTTFPELNYKYVFRRDMSVSMKCIFLLTIFGLYSFYCRIFNK